MKPGETRVDLNNPHHTATGTMYDLINDGEVVGFIARPNRDKWIVNTAESVQMFDALYKALHYISNI